MQAFSVNSVVTGDRVDRLTQSSRQGENLVRTTDETPLDRKTPHAFARSLWRIASIAPYELSLSRYCI